MGFSGVSMAAEEVRGHLHTQFDSANMQVLLSEVLVMIQRTGTDFLINHNHNFLGRQPVTTA